MTEVVQEKSRGIKFAEQQLLRHGWKHGKGLGRDENGISEAIKVKVKCDKGGVGHQEGEQFTFHWWDHVFNKASSNLQVESDQDGIKLKKMVEEDEDDGTISNKKPRKAALAKAKLYGSFVKSATLLSGQEQPEKKASDSDDSSSDEEADRRLDLSTTTQLSDADLMKACGGRTAHKGARHGLKMSAKLARLEQQEAEFMAKYGKKSQSASVSPDCVAATPPITEQGGESQEETGEGKQKKKKRSAGSVNGINDDDGTACEKDQPKKKKKKKRKDSENIAADISSTVICVENGETENSTKTKKKHKKKKNDDGKEKAAEIPEEVAEVSTEPHDKVKKKKKKSSKDDSDVGARTSEDEPAAVAEEPPTGGL
ncbi:G patch domain-containing protein 4 isoform X3 [Sphaeramia orbicularis]|uniref:G patch domain-containing protein 4 isoform X3 n=1 Tax=Sphaeramia orbicularis TaxID=375764 RepID=UPI00117CAF16|nr:G patch domain-containing protein 4 isoform X3 [Sphaeramia orbicularis]